MMVYPVKMTQSSRRILLKTPWLTPSIAVVFPLSSQIALCTFVPSRSLLSIFQVGQPMWVAGSLQI